MRELTEEGRRIAKEVLKMTDEEIDSFWFRMGYSLGSVEHNENLDPAPPIDSGDI